MKLFETFDNFDWSWVLFFVAGAFIATVITLLVKS